MQNIMGKNRPETPLKTPLKKAKIATPSMRGEMLLLTVNLFSLWFFFISRKPYCLINSDAGTGSTKRSGYVHVATPYPKQVKNRPSIIDSSKQSAGYSCKSCSK
jgi:hypothetical protein